MTFERKVLRNIYGPKFNAESQFYEKRKNQELQELYNRLNIISYIKSRQLEWFGHVWRAGGQIIKEVLVNKINKKTSTRKIKNPMGERYSAIYQKYRRRVIF
jgi:hypothetical protein